MNDVAVLRAGGFKWNDDVAADCLLTTPRTRRERVRESETGRASRPATESERAMSYIHTWGGRSWTGDEGWAKRAGAAAVASGSPRSTRAR